MQILPYLRNDRGLGTFDSFLRVLYVLSIIITAALVIRGWSFYWTPYQERPQQSDYRSFRPAGEIGHGVGVAGSAMMLFMLLYSLRKRTRIFGKWGHVRRWLDIHIYFGIVGPTWVVLHTSFKVQGLVALSFWSMVAVALSGVFGRYLYLQIPRSIGGEELSGKEIEDLHASLASQLTAETGLGQEILAQLETEVAPRLNETSGLIGSLWSIFRDDLKRPFRIRKLKIEYQRKHKLSHQVLDRLFNLARRRADLTRKMALLSQIQQIFHFWHVFHKPFAAIMYLIMLVHIIVAIWLGYIWIL